MTRLRLLEPRRVAVLVGLLSMLVFACSGSAPVEDEGPKTGASEGSEPAEGGAASEGDESGEGEASESTAQAESAASDKPDPGAAAAAQEPNGPEEIEFHPSKGVVLFPHQMHQDMLSCTDCHHTTKEDERPVLCRSCHVSNPDVKPDKMSRVFHMRCRQCHLENGGGPTKCSGCHQKKK